MKRLMIAAALFVGTAAVAQPAPPSSAPETETPPPVDTTAPDDTATSGPSTTGAAGAGAGLGAGASGGQTSAAASDSYPRCSATVRDHCIQGGGKATSRRGRR